MGDNTKLLEMFVLSNLVLTIWGILFLLCECGERVTIEFDKYDNGLQRCDWPKFPIRMQRMYVIFVSDAQKPKNITTYANLLLMRETFEKVF